VLRSSCAVLAGMRQSLGSCTRRGALTVFVKHTLLIRQWKREHPRGARFIVSRACGGERTNRDNESSDNGEYDLRTYLKIA
jgi:hypothetical protein